MLFSYFFRKHLLRSMRSLTIAMKLHSYLLFALVLICLAPSCFATWYSPVETSPVWYNPDHSADRDNTQLANFSTGFTVSGSNVVNMTSVTVARGTKENGILAGDFNDDGTQEFFIVNGTTAYIYELNNNIPVIKSSLNLGQYVVGEVYFVHDPNSAYGVFVVLTAATTSGSLAFGGVSAKLYSNGTVYFLRYGEVDSNLTLYRDYIATANDFSLPLASQLNGVGELYCRDATSSSAMVLCAVTGTNASGSNGAIVLFAPAYHNLSSAPYKPYFTKWNVGTSVNAFEYSARQCPYGQNCNGAGYEVFRNSHLLTIVHDGTLPPEDDNFQPSYSMYYVNTDSSKIYKVDLDVRYLQGIASVTPALANSAFGGTTGTTVSFSGSSSAYPMATDFALKHGQIEVMGWDWENTGIEQFCMLRGRDSASGSSYPQIETVCTNKTASLFYGLYGFGEANGGNSPYHTSWSFLRFSSPAKFAANELNVYPTICYAYGTRGGTTSISYKANNAIVCTAYNGTGFSHNVSQQVLNGNSGWPGFLFTNLVRFQPYNVFDTNMYVYWNGAISKWDGSAFVVNATVNTSSPYSSNRCAYANFALGSTLELGCINDDIFGVITTNPANFNASTYVAPYYDPTITDIWLVGGDTGAVCSESTTTYEMTKCDGTNAGTCSFFADSNIPVRIVTDCGTGTTTTGAWSLTHPTVSCVVPSGAGVLNIKFYLQDQSMAGDYSVYVTQTQTYQPDACGLAPITTPNKENPNPPGGEGNLQPIQTGQVTAAETPQAFFDLILGAGFSAWKLGIAFLMIIVGMVWVGNTDMMRNMHSEKGKAMVIGLTGFVLFILFTFAGLIPPWIFLLMLLTLILGVLAWRVFFPSVSQ